MPSTPADALGPAAVVALGGNALAPTGARSTIRDQFRHTRESLGPIVDLALDGWRLCVVHGNGPQVGDELLRNEIARHQASPLPLGVLVAGTAGWIGYMIQQSLENALRSAGSSRDVVTLVTQVEVDAADPALRSPSKFVGHELLPSRAAELAADGAVVSRDGSGRLRRVVPSPAPRAIHEIETVRRLVDGGTIVVAAGGGGVPIAWNASTSSWEGVEAVVDKDLASSVLARDLGAELLLILTDVDAVHVDWGRPTARALRRLSIGEAQSLDASGAFGEGSMAPKVRAALEFVGRTGGRAVITDLSRGREALRGEAGTTFTA